MAIACIEKHLNTLCHNRGYNSIDAKQGHFTVWASLNSMDSFVYECLPKNA